MRMEDLIRMLEPGLREKVFRELDIDEKRSIIKNLYPGIGRPVMVKFRREIVHKTSKTRIRLKLYELVHV